MIHLTNLAAKNFKRLAEDQEATDKHLRVQVKGGGCAGYEYVLEFDYPEERDHVFTDKEVNICVDRKSHLLIDGLEIDWNTDLAAPGPRYNNPRAKATCGCSTSFSIPDNFEFQEKPSWMQISI